MIYKQKYGGMWDPTVIYFKDKYYMISMHIEKADGVWDGLYVSESDDGVHFLDVGRVIVEDDAICKPFAHVMGDKVVVNCGAFSRRPGTDNDKMLFYVTEDMKHFEKVGYTLADPTYYDFSGRWDHMYVVKDEKEGYWGHIVATPLEKYKSSWGLQRSYDGINWQSHEPPVINWGEVPHIKTLETGGCEKIGDYYYYIAGMAGFANFYPYGIYVFRSKTPYGPFEPCVEKFRLCGASSIKGRVFVQNLACFVRGKDGELLLSNAIDAGFPENVWLLPMRKVVTDENDNLELEYWKGNDTLYGEEIKDYKFTLKDFNNKTANKENKEDYENNIYSSAYTNDPQLNDYYSVLTLDGNIDYENGIIFECEMTVKKNNEHCWRPMSVGFGADEGVGYTAILPEAGHPFRRKTVVETIAFNDGEVNSEVIDEIGNHCAGVKGTDLNKPVKVKFLIRKNMFELYLDDKYVQSFVTIKGPVNKMAMVVKNCSVKLNKIKINKFFI